MIYFLGWKNSTGKGACKGTIFHKVVEGLANIKLCQQNKEQFYTDEVFGQVDVHNFDIPNMVEQSFDYYKDEPKKPLIDKDLRDIKKWIETILVYQDGAVNPLNREIVKPEISIDIPLEQEWASFDYTVQNKKVKGQLCIKGTSDLLVKLSDGVYECFDWKTGAYRENHKTGEVKDLAYFQEKDFQLRLYHYSLTKMFPDIEEILVSIYYVNAGGVFTVSFDKKDLIKTEDMLRARFKEIQTTKLPELLSQTNKHFICKYCCDFSKPVKEGSPETWCQRIHRITKEKGIDYVIEKYKKPEFDLTHYQAPGAKDE